MFMKKKSDEMRCIRRRENHFFNSLSAVVLWLIFFYLEMELNNG